MWSGYVRPLFSFLIFWNKLSWLCGGGVGGCFFFFLAHLYDAEVMSSNMALHHSVVHVENGRVRLVEEVGPGPVTQEEAVFRRASAVLMCASYRNQALHVLIRPALVAVAMTLALSYSKGKLYYYIKVYFERLIVKQFLNVTQMWPFYFCHLTSKKFSFFLFSFFHFWTIFGNICTSFYYVVSSLKALYFSWFLFNL